MTAQTRLLSVRQLTLLVGMVATLAGFAWLLSAQDTTPPGFQAYRLKHAPAGEIIPQLDSMLSGEGTRYEIVVDKNGNRILVQGGEATQRIASQLIEALDQPVAKAPAAQVGPAVVRNYPVEPALIDKTLEQLRQKFPPQTGARIAADARTAQLLVVAPEEVQRRIAQTLRPAGAAQTSVVVAPAGGSTRGVTLQSISSRELEDGLSRLWGQRLTRTATNDGEVAVFSLASDSGRQPVLQVDRRHDSVSFLGAPESVQVWQRVVQALDRPRNIVEQQTDLVPLNRADPQKVQRAVNLLQTGGAAAGTPAARLASTTTLQEGASAPSAPPTAPAGSPAAGGEPATAPAGENASDLPADEGGLIGSVQIEFLQGLDVMVIRGHKRDVERVRKIIADIETSSVETQPSVEIVHLRYVGSQVLSELVTTVYDEVLSTRQGKVQIRALVKPNAVLLIGRPESVETVRSLIAKLDQPARPESQLQVFPLKYISATDAESAIVSFYVDRLTKSERGEASQQPQRPGFGTRVNAVAVLDYRVNALVVQASPIDMEEIRLLIAQIDIPDTKFEVFPLKHVSAQDAQSTIQSFFADRVGQTQPQGVRATMGQETRALGTRVNVVADFRSNALIVQARPTDMEEVRRLITHIDIPETKFEVFPLKHISATDAQEAVQNFFADLIGQTTQQQGVQGIQGQQGLGLGTRVNVVADYRSNALIVQARPADMEEVRRLIAHIDTPETKFQVFPLKHISATDAQAAVQSFFAARVGQTQAPTQQQGIRAIQGQQTRGLGTVVNVVADFRSNALIVQARPTDMEEVRRLITHIDIPETKFEVFPLKHISAIDAQETIQSFFAGRAGQTQSPAAQQGFQAIQGQQSRGLGTIVNVVADYRSNALIVQARPADMEEVRRMVAQLDIETAAAANELKIFRLKNALATDIGPVLQDALNWQLIGSRTPLGATRTGTLGGGQTFGQTDERARLRSAILSFMTVDAEGGKAIESGLLAEVRVTVDTNSNALVVTAPPKSMGLIEALIKELDALPNAQAQIKVFTIVNGDARSLASMLTQLLGQQSTTQAATGTLSGQGTLSPFLAAGMQSGAASGESSLVPVRFGVDQRTNSIIATGSEGDLGVVEAVLFRLDEQSLKEHKTMVYWLANVPAEEVATALNDWIQNRTTLFQQQLQISPESPEIQWNRRVIVVPETISNSIIISAAPELFDEVRHVVESIDRKPPLIKIDVMIAEVLLSHDFEFGTEFGLQDALLYDRNESPGFNFNNFPLGDTTDGNPANLLGQGLSAFGLGRVSPNLGYGGLVLSASSDAVSALIRALQEEGRAQILSRPTVTALDKQPAFINVGATVSRLAGTTLNNNNSQQNIEDVETGLTVAVTPQITPDGLIVMEVDAIKSELSTTEGVELPTGGVDGGTFTQYNINKAQAQTTISARSGQTIVFAGLIQASKANIVRGIPFLSDVPVLGHLFQFTKEEETRKELLIILTPHVIRSDDDLDRIRMAESERMSWCLADVMSLYGDVGFSARPGDWCDCRTEVPLIFPDANPTGIESVPAPMPAAGGEPDSVLPAPGHTGPGQMRILEPTVPADNPVAPAEPISNMSYPVPLPGGPYPGAVLGFGGANPMPQAQPAGPYLPGPQPPAARDPYTAARRLPQGP